MWLVFILKEMRRYCIELCRGIRLFDFYFNKVILVILFRIGSGGE